MTRVLVVSAQTLIAMSLQDEYEVTAVHPGDLGPIVLERGYDVTVLDAADVDATVHLLADLPRALTGPLLLLAHDEQSVLVLDAAKGLNDVRIGPPISGAALRVSLHGIASVPSAADVGGRDQGVRDTSADEPIPETRGGVAATLHRDNVELKRRLLGRPTRSSTLERAGTPAELLELSQSLPVSVPAEQAGRIPELPRRPELPDQPMSSTDLVDALLERLPTMLGVGVVAAAVADDACHRVRATAAAVLITDAELCVVAAGVGLRPLETRLQLDGKHWLVREVVRAGHGVIIADTDIARRDLVGAPLGAAQHLLVVPITEVGGLVMVARDASDVAFTRLELAAVARLATEAAGPLHEAMRLRELGRRLTALDSP